MQKKRKSSVWFCGCLLLCVLSISSAHGEFLEYTYAPRVAHVDLDKNIIVIAFSGAIPEYVIQRLDTEERLWSIPNQGVKTEFGEDAVAITRKGRIQVLDKATGRDVWSESGEHLNDIYYAYFIGSSRWIVVRAKDSIVYSPEGQPCRPSIPDKSVTKIHVVGRIQDNKTLLIAVEEEVEERKFVLTTYLWEPESGHIEEAYVSTSSGKPHLFGIFPDDKAVYWVHKSDYRDAKAILIDAVTGKEQRTFDINSNFSFTEEGYLVTSNETLHDFSALDMETGANIAVISEPEHLFNLHTRITDADKDWIISWDKEHQYWLWPIEENPQPRLIYKPPAGNYFPGSIEAIRWPHIFFNAGKSRMEAHLLDGMTCVKSWRAEGTDNRVFTDNICSELNRILAWNLKGGRGKEERVWTTQVFEAFNPSPLCTIPGCPRGITPDGSYCAVQNPENGPVQIVEVDSNKICAVIENEGGRDARVVFSPDNRFAGIHFNSGRNTLVSLEEPYEQRTIKGGNGLILSPDGNLYALRGTGEAKLYDLVTDRLIHIFVEPVKVQKSHESPPNGFLETAERFGRNIIGTFVPGNKETPPVNCKFSEDGKQLITTASGQVLRVWDVKSGKLIRTIYTKLAEERDEKGYINNGLVLSQNGEYAFAINGDGFSASSLWDVNTGRMITRDYLPKGKIEHVSVADDGSGVYMAIEGRIYFVAGKKQ